jgi:hypothetical protein
MGRSTSPSDSCLKLISHIIKDAKKRTSNITCWKNILLIALQRWAKVGLRCIYRTLAWTINMMATIYYELEYRSVYGFADLGFSKNLFRRTVYDRNVW